MTTATAVKEPKKPRKKREKSEESVKPAYDPYKFERLLELVSESNDGVITFKTQSFTNNKHIWHPMVDTDSCRVECDCPDFQTRKYPTARRNGMIPTCYSPYLCKHLLQAVLVLKQMGRLLEPEEIETSLPPDEENVPLSKKQPKLKKTDIAKSAQEMMTEALKASHADDITGQNGGYSGYHLLSLAVEQLNASGFIEEARALERMREELRAAQFYLD